MYQQLGHSITLIDTGLMGHQIAACYLLESNGEAAIIETGNYQTVHRILDLLEQKNINKADVKYIIPTHVHLDHAGGASSLMEALPESKLVIHPRGARHMIDPSKLVAGATVVYGEEKFKAMYGEIKAIDEQRIIIAEDDTSLYVGDRRLVFRDTPGHASHHLCVWDELSRGWFTGDTFGVSYPMMKSNKGRFVFPTTSPVQFDPELLKSSINLMMSYKPERMYLTHYGVVEVNTAISDELCKQVDDYVALVDSLEMKEDDGTIDGDHLTAELAKYTLNAITEQGCTVSQEKLTEIINMDIKLNSQGLVVWHARQMKKAQMS